MKVILYSTCAFWSEQQQLIFDEAIRLHEQEGNEVILVYCDSSMELCFLNSRKDSKKCIRCQVWNSFLSQKLPRGIKKYRISQIMPDDLQRRVSELDFKYTNIQDIHNLKFGSAYIGFAALSSYITLTRCNNPKIDAAFKQYFDQLLKVAVKLYITFESFIEKEQPDRIELFNGRMYETRPLFDLVLSKNVEVHCIDWITGSPKKYYKERFVNALPHNIKNRMNLMISYWKNSPLPENEKKKIADNFYKRRQMALNTESLIFTKEQEVGLLPADWCDEKENIAIFNSSEDEYTAIGKEWTELNLFENQVKAIKTILDHYQNDTAKHFYLRVHPNLKAVKYKYHTDLYNLRYPNLTVISADSNVSTYSLIKAVDKVIVFGSSTGIEASFCNKPVIQLSGSMYYYMDVTYTPKNISEIYSLIDKKNLPSKNGESVSIFGYYLMNDDKEKMYKLPLGFKRYKIFKRNFCIGLQHKIFRSSLLYLLIDAFIYGILRILKKDDRLVIPTDEN